MNEEIYQIRSKERHNVKGTLTLGKRRLGLYLAAMRDRFDQPTWGLFMLLPRVLREWYAMYESRTLPGMENDNG